LNYGLHVLYSRRKKLLKESHSSWFMLQFFGVGFAVRGQGMVYWFMVHVPCTVDGSIVNVIFHGSWLRIQCSEFMLPASWFVLQASRLKAHGLCYMVHGSYVKTSEGN
jgi:hypothetical protein